MSDNLSLEKEILNEKKNKIQRELNDKISNESTILSKLKNLTKEAKGGYNEEKETTEKIYSYIKKDIEGFQDALSAPYFGRVDFRERFGNDENLYIGKKGISATDDGEEIVIDWRAPVADLYYSGTGGEAYYRSPSGIIEGDLSLKRKFLFKDGDIQEIFDEGINEIIINGLQETDLVDEFLKVNLEESRGKKLKEVVATIQKEQNDIIRWPKNLPIIVQGSAGSGKTTVALHRLAYLIYRYAETIQGKDIMVLAPNKLFLNYISDILPNLGVEGVVQTTFGDIVTKRLKLKGKIKSKDEKLKEIIEATDEHNIKLITSSSTVKGSMVFKEIIDRYLTLLESSSLDINDIEVCGYTLFSKREITRLYLKDLKTFPINKRKDEIKRYLNLKIKEKIESILLGINLEWDIQIKEIKSNMEDSQERRDKLIEVYGERDKLKETIQSTYKKVMNDYFKTWRGITSKDIYLNLFKQEEILDIACGERIPEELLEFMKSEVIDNTEKGIVDEDDLAPLLYINMLLEGVEEKEKYMHIVVDEAQDYSPFQVFLVNKLSKGNSMTLVGDLGQGIYYYKGIKTWKDIIDGVFLGKATYIQLTQSYRSTVEIIDFANKALHAQNLGLKDAMPVLRHGEDPQVIKCNDKKEAILEIDKIIEYINIHNKSSIAIIVKTITEGKELEKYIKKYSKYDVQLIKGNDKEEKSDIVIIPAYLTKGLEFDGTIIYNPSKDKYEDKLLDQRLLYVALTRALHYEFVITLEEVSSYI